MMRPKDNIFESRGKYDNMPIEMHDINGHLATFKNADIASKITGINKTNIFNCITERCIKSRFRAFPHTNTWVTFKLPCGDKYNTPIIKKQKS